MRRAAVAVALVAAVVGIAALAGRGLRDRAAEATRQVKAARRLEEGG